MPQNRLAPQATAAFNARLGEILCAVDKDVLHIRKEFNVRGLLYSSETVQAIYRRLDEAIAEIGKAASESVKLAYDTGHHNFSESLEGELLDAFESNFSSGFQRVCDARIGATQAIRDGLLNKRILENDEHFQMARRMQIQGQLELRKFVQTINKARTRWYEYIPSIIKFVSSFFKSH